MIYSVVISDGSFKTPTAPLVGSFADDIREAARIGYEAVSLVVHDPKEIDAAAVKAVADECGIRISAIATGSSYSIDGLCLSAGDEDVRLRAVQRMKEYIDLGEAVGGAYIVIGAIRGRETDAESRSQYMSQLCRTFHDLLPYAESKGIIIMLEANVNAFPGSILTVDLVGSLIRAINSPSLRLQLDIIPGRDLDKDAAAPIREYADIIVQIDISGAGRSCPQEGEHDFRPAIQAMLDVGYAEILSSEYAYVEGENTAEAGYKYLTGLVAELSEKAQ